MKRFLLAFLFLFPFLANAQNLNITWLDAIGGAAGDEVVQSTVVDASGNVYIAGSFTGTVNFNPQGTVTSLSSAGDIDAFFAKYTSAGVLVWAKQLGAANADEVYGVTVDASGNVYVAGYFNGTVDFDPSASVGNLTASGSNDIFYGKYSSAGALIWVNSHGSTGFDAAVAIKVDASSNVLVTGYFNGTVDFDPSPATLNKTSAGAEDAFLIKLSSAGALLWVDVFGSTASDGGLTVDTDNSNVYVGGYYDDTIDLDPSGTAASNATNLGGDDGFFGKYNSSTGSLAWWATVRSTGNDEVTSIALSGTSFYLGGVFSTISASFFSNSGSVTKASNGGKDIFVAKYDGSTSLPTLSWVNTIGGSSDDRLNLLALDALANVYTTGYYVGTADFDPSTAATTNLVSNSGSQDIYVASFASGSGALNFAKSIGGSSDDEGTTIAVDGSGNVYVGGYFQGTTSFDFISSAQDKTSLGAWDAFLAKYAQVTLATEPTAQPTSLVFSNQTSSSFDYVFTAASGAPAGYIVLRSSGSPVTGIPVDGTVYSVGDALGNAFVRSTTVVGGTTYTASGLTAATTYYTAIFSYNGSGATINYRQVSPLTGNTATTAQATEPTNSPTNLTFTNITSNSYSISFTAAAGTVAPDGYLGIIKIGSAPTGIPTDGVTYSTSDAIGDGTVNFVGTGTTYDESAVTPSTSYYYAIFSYKGSGASIDYKQISPLTGFVTTLSNTDATPPVISANTTPTTSKSGQAIKVSLTVTDPESGVSSVEMNYGESTSFNWTETYVQLVNTSGNIWEFTIPATAVKEQGIEYIVTAYNNNGDYSDTGILGVTITIDQNGITIPFTAGSAQTNYKIVSIPLALESKTVDNVFGDDFGKYGDKSKWRLFRYSGGKTNELNGSSSINPGEGYWLLSSTSTSLDSGPGKTVGRISDPFTINVTQGFNQIGNPYVINLLWDDIKTYSYDTHDNSTLGLGNLRTYSGGSWSNGTILNKYEGGFVMATTAGTLVFPAEKKAAAGRIQTNPVVPVQNALDNDNWEVNFELSNSNQAMNFSGIGMNKNASDQYDKFDDFTLPRFMDYIELNHASKDLFNLSYTKDIVPTSENHVWEFFVESNANELMTMKWDNSYFGKNDKQLVLWDINQQRGLDMRSIRQYIFNKSSSGHFKVYFGDEKFIKEKTAVDQLVFHDVFPNPATDRVTISFSVPTDDHVTVEVIDLLGRKIATVADGNFTSGYHEINWNATDSGGNTLSNGIYIMQVKTLYREQQKRLSINK